LTKLQNALTRSIAVSSARLAEAWGMTYPGPKKCESDEDGPGCGRHRDAAESQQRLKPAALSDRAAHETVPQPETRSTNENPLSNLKSNWLKLQRDLCGDLFSSGVVEARDLTKDWFSAFFRPVPTNPFSAVFQVLSGRQTDRRAGPDVFGWWTDCWENAFRTHFYTPYHIQRLWTDCFERCVKAQIRSIEAIEQALVWGLSLSQESCETTAKKLHRFDLTDSAAEALNLATQFWMASLENALSEQLRTQAAAAELRENFSEKWRVFFPILGLNESRNSRSAKSVTNLLEEIISRLDELEDRVQHAQSAIEKRAESGLVIDADDMI
jgi:hypothetical protein